MMFFFQVSKKEQNPKTPVLPGVSYLPDKIEVAENPYVYLYPTLISY